VYQFFLNYTGSEVLFLRMHERFDIETVKVNKLDSVHESLKIYEF
jgi:hypothetical protein